MRVRIKKDTISFYATHEGTIVYQYPNPQLVTVRFDNGQELQFYRQEIEEINDHEA